MALSDGEQRRLDEIERALRSEDPGFAATITISRVRRHRAVVAAVAFVLGMLCLVVGLVTTDAALWAGIAIAVIGVLAMVGATVLYLRPGWLSGLTGTRRPTARRRRRR
jgi:multidrug efflux pump subunit AcrB